MKASMNSQVYIKNAQNIYVYPMNYVKGMFNKNNRYAQIHQNTPPKISAQKCVKEIFHFHDFYHKIILKTIYLDWIVKWTDSKSMFSVIQLNEQHQRVN